MNQREELNTAKMNLEQQQKQLQDEIAIVRLRYNRNPTSTRQQLVAEEMQMETETGLLVTLERRLLNVNQLLNRVYSDIYNLPEEVERRRIKREQEAERRKIQRERETQRLKGDFNVNDYVRYNNPLSAFNNTVAKIREEFMYPLGWRIALKPSGSGRPLLMYATAPQLISINERDYEEGLSYQGKRKSRKSLRRLRQKKSYKRNIH